MPQDLRSLRRKIKTVHNIWQITRAMKMVAAARVRRFEQLVKASRLYWDQVLELSQRLAAIVPDMDHPYLSEDKPERPALLVMAGDKGLCGSYNSLVFRRAEAAIAEVNPVAIFAVGDRARRWVEHRGIEPAGVFPAYGGRTAARVHADVARAVRSVFDGGQCDGVFMVYTPFRSLLYNVPRLAQVLPMGRPEKAGAGVSQYIFEPPAEELVRHLLPRAVEARLMQAVVESATSEQAARMTAMTAATDNAEEMRQMLTRQRNRLRQQEITTEMLEIVGGANALAAE